VSTPFKVPLFEYGQHVKITPLDGMKARVVDCHHFGALQAVEYDVRYFHEGKDFRIRVFEDELVPVS
jgi:hypothetical protein